MQRRALLAKNNSQSSDLPPLNPSSGAVYQPPNSTGSRNAVVETQRMRTAIMGQIQAAQSEQDRQIQQAEAQMSIVSRELSPKMQNLDRHNSFNQQQLDDLIERLSQLDSTIIPAIHQKNDEVQLKFEQSIRSETQSKFKPIIDDIKHEQSRSEQLSDSTINGISSSSDKLRNLTQLFDEMTKQSNELTAFVQSHFDTLNPRIASIEIKLNAFENAAESSMKNQNNQSDLQRIARKVRKDLEELESDGIPLAVQSSASDTLADITSISSQIDQKFTSAKLALTNMENTVKMTTEQQKSVDSQVEDLAKSTIDTQSNIESEEQELNQRLGDLEASLAKINSEIGGQLNELEEGDSGNSQWIIDGFEDDIESLRSLAKKSLLQLKEDWILFHGNNKEAQKLVDGEINAIMNMMNGKISLVKRIAAAEKRAKWCVDRIQAWEKENEKKKQLKIDDDKLKETLETLESKLIDAEKRLAALDKEKAPEPYKITKKEKPKEGPPCPTPALSKEDENPKRIPPKLKLTYDEHDVLVLLPTYEKKERVKPQPKPKPQPQPKPQPEPEPEPKAIAEREPEPEPKKEEPEANPPKEEEKEEKKEEKEEEPDEKKEEEEKNEKEEEEEEGKEEEDKKKEKGKEEEDKKEDKNKDKDDEEEEEEEGEEEEKKEKKEKDKKNDKKADDKKDDKKAKPDQKEKKGEEEDEDEEDSEEDAEEEDGDGDDDKDEEEEEEEKKPKGKDKEKNDKKKGKK